VRSAAPATTRRVGRIRQYYVGSERVFGIRTIQIAANALKKLDLTRWRLLRFLEPVGDGGVRNPPKLYKRNDVRTCLMKWLGLRDDFRNRLVGAA